MIEPSLRPQVGQGITVTKEQGSHVDVSEGQSQVGRAVIIMGNPTGNSLTGNPISNIPIGKTSCLRRTVESGGHVIVCLWDE